VFFQVGETSGTIQCPALTTNIPLPQYLSKISLSTPKGETPSKSIRKFPEKTFPPSADATATRS
jgi:hypothetical protein